MLRFPFDNSYARLPGGFYQRSAAATVSRPQLVALNRSLAEALGLDLADTDEAGLAEIFAGVQLPEGAQPLAMAYSGHQFGNFVPTLGDGRALLLGEVIDASGQRRDIQLKGAGRTPFSRGGDGLCPLGPGIREYLVSEAMHALGVPTTRALALVTTGETALREVAHPASVLTRVAASHVRVGTFQYFAARDDRDNLERLADYVIQRHYPEIEGSEAPYRDLLAAIAARQAVLIAHWMRLGFIHGVMNTDNMAVSGETIDYGPCAFMDEFRADARFSFIDQHGRYAYANQPALAVWNLSRLAEAMLPLLHDDQDTAVTIAQEVLEGFMPAYEKHWLDEMRRKLGLLDAHDDDGDLAYSLFEAMQANRVDFTLLFQRLSTVVDQPTEADAVRVLFGQPEDWDAWEARWRQRLDAETGDGEARKQMMLAANPAVIPRNHLIERAIRAAEDDGDFAVFHRLREALIRPFEVSPGDHDLVQPPEPGERVTQTFCGT